MRGALSVRTRTGSCTRAPSYYADALCGPDDDEEDEEDALCLLRPRATALTSRKLVLEEGGDLHIDPRKLEDYEAVGARTSRRSSPTRATAA